MAGIGELSVDAICRELNTPRSTRGHVGWSMVHEVGGCFFVHYYPPQRRYPNYGAGSLSSHWCHHCLECGWCRYELLIKDPKTNLPKAGGSACSLKRSLFLTRHFLVNKRFYNKWFCKSRIIDLHKGKNVRKVEKLCE